jgi:hypothetical protein
MTKQPVEPTEPIESIEIDPFVQFRRSLDMLVAQRAETEQQIANLFQHHMVNLQIYFNKLISIPQEQPPARQYPQPPPYIPPQYQIPFQQQQPYSPPIIPIEDVRPKWEKEVVEESKPKKKRSANKLLIIGGGVLLLMIYLWYASSHGWVMMGG